MQNINNHMDELFKQAATGYPLKTDNSDWDTLASRLFNIPVAPVPGKKKNTFNKYGPSLLLVLLMLIIGETPLRQTRNLLTAYRPTALQGKANTPITKQDRFQRQSTYKTAFLPVTDPVRKNGNDMTGDDILYRTLSSNNRQTTESVHEKGTIKNIRPIDAPDLKYNTEQLAIASGITSAGARVPFNTTIDTAAAITEKKKDTIQRSSKIYWGIVFGPGINRVKNQKLLKPGFDIGIMAGISILKGRAFVEAGLLYTEKYYFSDGKYFNMDKAGGSMPQGMDVMSLEGSSRFFELPVKFKYNVFQKNRSGVFLSTGISSYLMTREENDYLAMMNGSEQNMSGSYNNNRRYMAVMANFGAEYNYKIGKHTRLRIEPYLQIPLKGIGIGSMPVMTTGLHFGFMRFTP
jgi:hypothetical protein